MMGRGVMTSFKQQLVEASLVSIPANPNAFVVANIRLGVMLPLTGAKLLRITFSGSGLAERRAITGHPARDLLLYCLGLLGPARVSARRWCRASWS